jgi:PAS domain S-box-containing protein
MPRVLVVEDSPTQAFSLRSLLEEAGFDVEHVETLRAAKDRLADQHDVPLVLLDLGLPDGSGLDVFRSLRDTTPGTAIVVLTGLDDESVAIKAVHEGDQDYLVKGQAEGNLLLRCVRYALERQRAENELQASRDDMLSILNQLRIGTIMTDSSGHITFFSRACQPFFGKAQSAVLGRPWFEALPLPEQDAKALSDMASRSAVDRVKVSSRVEAPGGHRYWVDIEVQDDPRDPMRKILCLYDTSELYDLRRLLGEKAQFHDLVGKSEAMLQVYEIIRQVAPVDSTVLIEGETGTGKELVARAIHSSSNRKSGPFIAVNCAGLTDSLLASQLFGHKRGAFTGAIEDHKGFFEAAHGGTLFLDEIGDVPMTVQTNLLRVLQEREIIRLGESKPRKIDVRVLVATHRDLNKEVAAGAFRTDLLYRIRVARIQLPPLRERRVDIPLLAASFLSQCRAATGKAVHEISQEAMSRLMGYAWPGNVRELKSAIEFAVIRCRNSVLDVTDLPPELQAEPRSVAPVQDPIDETPDERARILSALERAKGNRARAARLLGVSRATFYRRLDALGIDLGRERDGR